MPQVRDPKTGRYTSGGGSSVGGAASTNPRISKAKAVGGGAAAGGTAQDKYERALEKVKATKPGSEEYWNAVSAAERVYSKSGKPTNSGINVGDRVEYYGFPGTVTKVVSPDMFEYKVDAEVVKANKGMRISAHRSLGAAQRVHEPSGKDNLKKLVSGK